MKIVGVVSMKGGVGKTAITANLAAALASGEDSRAVLALDFSPQNALCAHFNQPQKDMLGISDLSDGKYRWTDIAHDNEFSVGCYPFGTVSDAEREAFEARLSADPEWLRKELLKLKLPESTIVLVDTPPGPSIYLEQVTSCADLVLVVLLPDPASYITIPAMENWIANRSARSPLLSFYLVNQSDNSVALHQDVIVVLQSWLRDRLVPIGLHRDEAVRDSLAYQTPFVKRYPYSQITQDVHNFSEWLTSQLSGQ